MVAAAKTPVRFLNDGFFEVLKGEFVLTLVLFSLFKWIAGGDEVFS